MLEIIRLSTQLIRLAILIPAVAIAVSGCSGDDGSEDGSGASIEASSLTKAQFIKRANTICVAGSNALFKLLPRYLNGPRSQANLTPDELSAEAVHEVVLPRVETMIREIHDLGAPSGDESQIEAFLSAMQESVDALEGKRSLSLDRDLNPAFHRSAELAREYGISSCAYA